LANRSNFSAKRPQGNSFLPYGERSAVHTIVFTRSYGLRTKLLLGELELALEHLHDLWFPSARSGLDVLLLHHFNPAGLVSALRVHLRL
jgi:hypothetical protein